MLRGLSRLGPLYLKHELFPNAWVYDRHTVMPTVLRLDGLRVVIYPDDHRPAHVHVIGAKGEAVFVLNCPDGPPRLRESYGFSRHEELRILKDLAAHLPTLCPKWSEIHGDF